MKKVLTWLFTTKAGLLTLAMTWIVAANSNASTPVNTQADVLQAEPNQATEQTVSSHYQIEEQVVEQKQESSYQAPSNTTVTEVQKAAPAPTPTSEINYYTNSQGNTVQSPTYYNSAPAGATAQCRDGTYSFSQSRRGTCSHHGGVEQWL